METSLTLLESLQPGDDAASWAKLVELYDPLIRHWLVRHGANANDVDDVIQDVFAVVVRRLPEFEHRHRGGFRGWLRAIATNCVRDHWRRSNRQPQAVGGSDFGRFLEQWDDPDSDLSRVWDREHDQHVTRYLIEQIRPQFSDGTWNLFARFALEGHSADDVAREFGTTPNAVFIAKSRVMARFRQLAKGVLEF